MHRYIVVQEHVKTKTFMPSCVGYIHCICTSHTYTYVYIPCTSHTVQPQLSNFDYPNLSFTLAWTEHYWTILPHLGYSNSRLAERFVPVLAGSDNRGWTVHTSDFTYSPRELVYKDSCTLSQIAWLMHVYICVCIRVPGILILTCTCTEIILSGYSNRSWTCSEGCHDTKPQCSQTRSNCHWWRWWCLVLCDW